MKKAIGILAASVLVLSMLLTACSTGSTPTTTTKTTAAATTTTTPPRTTAIPTATTPAAGTPIYGGVFKFGASTDPNQLLPGINAIKNSQEQPPYDTLLRLDEQGNIAAWLATEWKLASDSKSLTLTLRKGVKFHDGTDFNAEAAKFSIQLRKDAKIGDFETVSSMDVVDNYTLRLNFSTFRNTIWNNLWFIGGSAVSPTAYNIDGPQKALFHPVGTGPFKFVNFEPHEICRFVKFDAYWQKGKPYVNEFNTIIIADPTTRELAFRGGEIHTGEGLTLKVASDLEKQGTRVLKGAIEMYNVLVPDSANADSPYSKQKVREALDYAINKDAVAKAFGYGMMEGFHQAAPTGSYAYVSTIKPRVYDPAKAKALLAEAGYPNGFKTTILTRGSIVDQLVAVKTDLAAVGINAEIDLAQPGRFVELSTGGWKNMLIYRAYRIPPDWLSFVYSYSSATVTESKSMLRPTGFQELLEQALAAPDIPGKTAASQKVTQKIFDDAIYTPLWGQASPLAVQKNVRNVEYYMPWGPNKLWGPADVWLDK